MKFLITLLLLSSMSVFATDSQMGQEGGATTEHVTSPCDEAVNNETTNAGSRTDASGGVDGTSKVNEGSEQ